MYTNLKFGLRYGKRGRNCNDPIACARCRQPGKDLCDVYDRRDDGGDLCTGSLSIPIGEVPISFTNLVIYFTLYLLGWKRASVSYIVYMLIGMVGVPVFSGFAGGLGKLAGPTGGYIIGFLPMAVIAGLVIDHTHSRILQLLGMVLGTAVCYALGTAWFCFSTNTGVMAALWMCVIPFIVGDLVKMALAMTMGPMIRGRLEKAGLLQI